MADSALEALKQQLKSDDAKARRKACQQLGKLGDHAAIPVLVRVYKDAGEDPKVQEAAADALKRYARQIPSEGGASGIVKMLVYGLAALFLVLIIGNVVLRLGRGEEEVADTPSGPTPRENLIAEYQTLLTEIQADFALMQVEWANEAGLLPCASGDSLARPRERELSEIDKATYPDFAFVNQLNFAVFRLREQVVRLYDLACASDENSTVQQDIDAANALREIDVALQTVATQLTEAINNPLPTIAPTTPLPPDVLTATAQAPTITPTETPAPTATATLGRLELTPVPTTAP
jgi:hypothetical protein